MTYEAVALRSAGDAVGDDDGLEDLAELLEVVPHGLLGGLPCQTSDEDLRQRRVAELISAVTVAGSATHIRRRLIDQRCGYAENQFGATYLIVRRCTSTGLRI